MTNTQTTPDAFDLLEETQSLLSKVGDQLLEYHGRCVREDLDAEAAACSPILRDVWAQEARIQAALRAERNRLKTECHLLNMQVGALTNRRNT